jgi:hypothetical protein
MRWIFLLNLLVASLAVGAPSRPPKRRPAPVAEPEPKSTPTPTAGETSRKSEPSRAAASTRGPQPIRYALALAGGAFYGGGYNRGPLVAAVFSLTPPIWSGRLALEAELDWRFTRFLSTVPDTGTVTSALHGVPLYLSGRLNVLRLGPVGLDARLGLGPSFALQYLGSSFSQSTVRTAVGWDALAALQLRVPISAVELFGEARFAFGEAPIPFVLGRATGLQGTLGVRYGLP